MSKARKAVPVHGHRLQFHDVALWDQWGAIELGLLDLEGKKERSGGVVVKIKIETSEMGIS